MPRYVVQMTFEVPAAQPTRPPARKGAAVPVRGRPWERSLRLFAMPGGRLVASATVPASSPASAASRVVALVTDAWKQQGGRGPVRLLSWTAHRPRVPLGARRRRGGSTRWEPGGGTGRGSDWGDGPGSGWDDDFGGGPAGVREPRRPPPTPGAMSVELPIPETGDRDVEDVLNVLS